MNKSILLASLLSVVGSAVLAQDQLDTYSVYDVNHDNVTNVGDATMAARRAIQSIQDDPQVVDAAQLNAVLNAISIKLDVLEKKLNEVMEQSGMHNPYDADENGVRSAGYEYVDMGVTDDQNRIVYWATCNIGAEKPEDQGLLFAWGETKGYAYNEGHDFNWENYKFMFEGESTKYYITKYTIPDGTKNAIWYEDYNATRFIGDNKTELEPIDDAAHVNWRGDWRMPTEEEFIQLWSRNDWVWDENRQVMVVTNRYTKASIILPLTKRYDRGSLSKDEGKYWTSTLFSRDSSMADNMSFLSVGVGGVGGNNRYNGYSIRPVCVASE